MKSYSKVEQFLKVISVGYINIVAACMAFMILFEFKGALKSVGRISADSGQEISFADAITSHFSLFSAFAFVPKIFIFWNFKAVFIAAPLFVMALLLACLFNFKIYKNGGANFTIVSIVYFLATLLLMLIGSYLYVV